MKSAASYRLTIARLVLVGSALGLAGCGGDDDPAGPINTDVVGEWAFQATGTSSSGTSCSLTGMVLTFTRTGNTLDGTASGDPNGAIACTPGGTDSFPGTAGLISAEQNGQNVEFAFNSVGGPWNMLGAVQSNGNTMNGSVTFPVNFNSGVEQFTGTWSATRN